MQASWGSQSKRKDPIEQLLLLKNRFSGGLHLKPEEILILEALHLLIEHEIEEDFLLESDLKDRILRTSDCLKLEIEPHQTNQIIQKLLQTGILRLTFGGTRQRYRLSRLGQSLAKCLLDEVDYGTDQLNALFTSALSGLKTARLAGNDSLKHYLIHVLFDTIEEKIESKVFAIEEDLARRKERVRQTYAGQSDESRDKAQSDIEASRGALTELVEAVRGSSACEALDSEIDDVIREVEDPNLKELLRRAGTFIYRFRAKIDLMLSDLVEFIRNCAAYRALAFSVTARDRLCRAQEQILAYALEHPLEMPLLTLPEIPAWGLPPQRPMEKKPLVLDPARLKVLEEAPGEEWMIGPITLAILLNSADTSPSNGNFSICLGNGRARSGFQPDALPRGPSGYNPDLHLLRSCSKIGPRRECFHKQWPGVFKETPNICG